MSAAPVAEFRRVALDDPLVEPLLRGLTHEYVTRYVTAVAPALPSGGPEGAVPVGPLPFEKRLPAPAHTP